MQYNPMHLIQSGGGGPRQSVYVQQAMAQPRPGGGGLYIQQGYPGGGYMANYHPQVAQHHQQMVIQQQPEIQGIREPPLQQQQAADLLRAQQHMQQNSMGGGPVLAAGVPPQQQTQQLMSAQPVFVRTPNGIHVQQMSSMSGEEYMKSTGGVTAHLQQQQPNPVRPPYNVTPQRTDQQQLQQQQQLSHGGGGNNSNNNGGAQFVSTIQGIPLYSPNAQANLHMLSPQQGQQPQYLIEHSPVQLAQHHQQQQQFAAQQQQAGGGGSIYIVPNAAENQASQGPPLLSPCVTNVVDSLQQQHQQQNHTNHMASCFSALSPMMNPVRVGMAGDTSLVAGLSSPVLQQQGMHSPRMQAVIPNAAAAAVVQTVGTITMVTCGGNLNTVVVSMPSSGAPSSQPTVPGVANVNIVSASQQRPVCSVNLQNVLPGIGSLMTTGGPSSEMQFCPQEEEDINRPPNHKPQITLLRTETTVLTTAGQNCCVSHVVGGEVKNSSSSNIHDTEKKQVVASERSTEQLPVAETAVSCEGVFSSVVVPYGWRREVQEGIVLYYSPSGTVLRNHEEVCNYITAENTCKCGLLCPLRVETCFNFDVNVLSKPWTLEDVSCNNDLTKLCEHKHRIVTMATLQNSAQMQQQLGSGTTLGFLDQDPEKERTSSKKGVKKKKKKAKQQAAGNPLTLCKTDLQCNSSENPPRVLDATGCSGDPQAIAAGGEGGDDISCGSDRPQCLIDPVALNTSSSALSVEPLSGDGSTTNTSSGTGGTFPSPSSLGSTVMLDTTVVNDTAGSSTSVCLQPRTLLSHHTEEPPPSVAGFGTPTQNTLYRFRPDDPFIINSKSYVLKNRGQGGGGKCRTSPRYNVPSLAAAGCQGPVLPMETVQAQRCSPGQAPVGPLSINPSHNILGSPDQLYPNGCQPGGGMGQVLYSLATQQGQQMAYVQSSPPGSMFPMPQQPHVAMVSPPQEAEEEEVATFKWANVHQRDEEDHKPLKKKRARKNNNKKAGRNNHNTLTFNPAHLDEAIENVARSMDSVTPRRVVKEEAEEEGEPSFLDNPTAFMAQQTAIVNSSLIPGTSPPYKPQAASSSVLCSSDTTIGTKNAILLANAVATAATTQDSEIVKLLNAPAPRRRRHQLKGDYSSTCDNTTKSATTAGLSSVSRAEGGSNSRKTEKEKRTITTNTSGTQEGVSGTDDTTRLLDNIKTPTENLKLCSDTNQQRTVDQLSSGTSSASGSPEQSSAAEKKVKKGRHNKPEPIDTSSSASLADSSVQPLGSPPVAMSTPKMSVTMSLGQIIQSPSASTEEDGAVVNSNSNTNAVQCGTGPQQGPLAPAAIVPSVSSPKSVSLQLPLGGGVLHGRYRLGTPASSEQKVFPASQMLSAAARAQNTGSSQMLCNSSPSPAQHGGQPHLLPPGNPQQNSRRMMSPPNHHNTVGYPPPFPPPPPPRMAMVGPVYRGGMQRFAAPGPLPPQMMMQQQQVVAPPGGEWPPQNNRMMFVERPLRPPMSPMQAGQAFSGPRGSQKSPIQMVQNMIYGLQASQNALAVAMQPELPNKRRRKSTSSDGSGRSSARPNSVSSLEYGNQQMLYEGQYQFYPHQTMDGQMFIPTVANPANQNMQANPMQQIMPNMVVQALPTHSQAPPAGLSINPNMVVQAPPPGMPTNQVMPGYVHVPPALQQQPIGQPPQPPMMMTTPCVAMETTAGGSINRNQHNMAAVVFSQPHLDPASAALVVQQQQDEEDAVSEMLPSITTTAAVPSGPVSLATATVTNAISEEVIPTPPALLSQGGGGGHMTYTSVDGGVEQSLVVPVCGTPMVSSKCQPAASSTSSFSSGSITTTPAGKAKKHWKKKKKASPQDTQPVLTGTIAKILESAKREMEAQKQQPEVHGKTTSSSKTTASPCKHGSPVKTVSRNSDAQTGRASRTYQTDTSSVGVEEYNNHHNPALVASPGQETTVVTDFRPSFSEEEKGDFIVSAGGESSESQQQPYSVSTSDLSEVVPSQVAFDFLPAQEAANLNGGEFVESPVVVEEEEERLSPPQTLMTQPASPCDNTATNDDNDQERMAESRFLMMEAEENNTMDSHSSSVNYSQEMDDIPDETDFDEDEDEDEPSSSLIYRDDHMNSNPHLMRPSSSDNTHLHHINNSGSSCNIMSNSHKPMPPMSLANLYAGHIDMLSTSYAIRTPRVFTSAKARSAARILRKARKGGMRKIKRSFPGQLGDIPQSPEDCHHQNSNGDDNLSRKKLKKTRCIDKNFNSCSPSEREDLHEDLLSDDNDSATHSPSEMDTSRCSQSSDMSAHTEEVNDPSTDDSGINCCCNTTGGGGSNSSIKPKTIGAKRTFQQHGGEECTESPPPRSSKYGRSFNVGDVVWGESRGFPSWPGKLVHESDVKKGHYNGSKLEEGKLWVRWFGNHTFAQVEPGALKTLSEGLEAHHRERQHFRKGRKLSRNLDDAIQEAMGELDRQTPADDTSGANIPSQNRVNLVKKKKR